MATINIFDTLIKPIHDRLRSDPRFRRVKNILYDRTEERSVPREATPAINYFLESPWDDLARGSGGFSLNSRDFTARFGFGIWVYGGDSVAETDRALFQISGNLFDFFRDNRYWDRTNGITIEDEIRWDVDYQGDETNSFLATQKLSVEFKYVV